MIYAAIWRVLPGPLVVRVLLALALVLAVVALCFLWLFPLVAPLLPFNDNTVDGSSAVHQQTGHTLHALHAVHAPNSEATS